jgi:hypothetical protein
MNNRSAYKTDDDKIKELKFKLWYFKGDDFISYNRDKINENTRKIYDNMLYNCKKIILMTSMNLIINLHYLKKNGRPNEWWKNEIFQTIMQN